MPNKVVSIAKARKKRKEKRPCSFVTVDKNGNKLGGTAAFLKIAKENDIKVDKAIVPTLVSLAKDKEVVIQLCKEILPRVNNTFCAYKEIEREYYDKQDQDKNVKTTVDKIESIAVLGTDHKRFGYCEPVAYSDTDSVPYYEVFNGSDKRIVKVAIPIKYTHII